KDARQHQQERPRHHHRRTARVEDEERAPQGAERELRGGGDECAPAEGGAALLGPRFGEMLERDGRAREQQITGEYGLRGRMVDAAEGEIVESEATTHSKRQKLTLVWFELGQKTAHQ